MYRWLYAKQLLKYTLSIVNSCDHIEEEYTIGIHSVEEQLAAIELQRFV